ncbi:hypothetical protein KC366_g18 [Hortaea werneckii]|nr:hypothetical protein KC366_g18 [Hortaea werneckii]
MLAKPPTDESLTNDVPCEYPSCSVVHLERVLFPLITILVLPALEAETITIIELRLPILPRRFRSLISQRLHPHLTRLPLRLVSRLGLSPSHTSALDIRRFLRVGNCSRRLRACRRHRSYRSSCTLPYILRWGLALVFFGDFDALARLRRQDLSEGEGNVRTALSGRRGFLDPGSDVLV